MSWKQLWLPAAVMFCLAGCRQSADTQSRPSRQIERQDARTMTLERLQSERLPTLESVELWDSKYGPGLKLTTGHYEVFTTVLEPLTLRTVPGFLESAY